MRGILTTTFLVSASLSCSAEYLEDRRNSSQPESTDSLDVNSVSSRLSEDENLEKVLMDFVSSDRKDYVSSISADNGCGTTMSTADGYYGPTGTAPGANVDVGCYVGKIGPSKESYPPKKTFYLNVLIIDPSDHSASRILCKPWYFLYGGPYAYKDQHARDSIAVTDSYNANITLSASCDASKIMNPEKCLKVVDPLRAA